MPWDNSSLFFHKENVTKSLSHGLEDHFNFDTLKCLLHISLNMSLTFIDA